MSDSDDTDVLLLIPPDFFNAPSNATATPLPAHQLDYCIRELGHGSDALFGHDANQSYKSSILTTMSGKRVDGFFPPRAPESGYGYQSHLNGDRMYYSTPLKGHGGDGGAPKNQFLLHEIDNFLQVGGKPNGQSSAAAEVVKSPDASLIDMNSLSINEYPSLTASDFNGLSKVGAVPQKPPRKEIGSRMSLSSRPPLLSLSEIWNSNAINQESSKVQEERLRRQHCERNIHALQAKLLEYEQKIAVAIDVDKEKEGIILRLEENEIRLNQQIRDIELRHAENHEKLLHENLEMKNKNLFMEKELAETISLVRKLQDKNDSLESKVESLTTANRDVSDVHKDQLKDLEIRLSNSRESERNLKEQLAKTKKSFEQLKDEFEVERRKSEESAKLRADFASLKVKTDNLGRKFTDANAQNESFRKQIEDLKGQINTHMEEKKNLLKELDVQRLSLKKYYQSQLEDVVGDKLKEFQKQLTSVEEQLKADAKKKERLLAERAIKQIELINQTNEQEIKLLNEKYSEQEALYRLQLANSAKTIHELEDKLAGYQNRRANIAEQLHSIMEVQWQKALEVLTSPAAPNNNNNASPTRHFNRLSVEHLDKDQLDGVRTLRSVTESEGFERTPVRANGCSLPRDLLHNYIELLLEKSPSDLKELEGVLGGGRRQDQQQQQVNRRGSREKVSPQQTAATKPTPGTTANSVNVSLGQLSKTLGKTPRPWK